MSNLTVVLMGLGTVFFGLICIIFLCYIMSAIVKLFVKPEKKEDVKPEKSDTIQNKGEFVAAISAAIAEDLGKDISAIRITKIKKI